MKTEAARRKVVEMLCRGLPKTKVSPSVSMAKCTFDRHLAGLCKAAGLPTDTRIWYLNRDAIMRNYERYEKFLKDEKELYTKYRQSLEQTNVYLGRSRVEDFRPIRKRKEKKYDDDLLA